MIKRSRSREVRVSTRRGVHSSVLVNLELTLRGKTSAVIRMMGMVFHFGVAEVILFEGWRINDWQGIVGSMVGIVLLAAAYEGLKNYREQLYFNSIQEAKCDGKKRTRRDAILSAVHLYQTILHMIQFVIGYFLMFIFMTYNVWLALATVIGTGLGYWLFAWNKFTTEDNDCCS